MIGKMAIAAALPGYNDLGRLVTHTFLSRNRFYSQLSPHCPKMNKNQCWKFKKNSRFLSTGHRILPSCGCKARETMVAKYELGLKGTSADNISLQRFNCIIFGPTHIVALFVDEARFFRFRVIFQACSLLNEVGDPPFFLHF